MLADASTGTWPSGSQVRQWSKRSTRNGPMGRHPRSASPSPLRSRSHTSCRPSSDSAPCVIQCPPTPLSEDAAYAAAPCLTLRVSCSWLRQGRWRMRSRSSSPDPDLIAVWLPIPIQRKGDVRLATFLIRCGGTSSRSSPSSPERRGFSAVGKALWIAAWTRVTPLLRKYAPTVVPGANQNSSASNGTTHSAPARLARDASAVILWAW
ncbi:hypothetical protein ACFPRL_23650 [Pseudoclavibacter helvolus]